MWPWRSVTHDFIFSGSRYIYLAFPTLSRIEKGCWRASRGDEHRWWLSGLFSDIWLREFSPADWIRSQPSGNGSPMRHLVHQAEHPTPGCLSSHCVCFLPLFSSVLLPVLPEQFNYMFVLNQELWSWESFEESRELLQVDSLNGRWRDNRAVIGGLISVAK